MTRRRLHLHTNGCGDFTLMARDHWMDLRGYPEFDMFSMNIDSMLCFAAHHGNVLEEMLKDPMRIYHIEHGIGSGWTPEGSEKGLFERVCGQGAFPPPGLSRGCALRPNHESLLSTHDFQSLATGAWSGKRLRRQARTSSRRASPSTRVKDPAGSFRPCARLSVRVEACAMTVI